jgi:hypothetical protein
LRVLGLAEPKWQSKPCWRRGGQITNGFHTWQSSIRRLQPRPHIRSESMILVIDFRRNPFQWSKTEKREMKTVYTFGEYESASTRWNKTYQKRVDRNANVIQKNHEAICKTRNDDFSSWNFGKCRRNNDQELLFWLEQQK